MIPETVQPHGDWIRKNVLNAKGAKLQSNLLDDTSNNSRARANAPFEDAQQHFHALPTPAQHMEFLTRYHAVSALPHLA
jgi:hypothetical protein